MKTLKVLVLSSLLATSVSFASAPLGAMQDSNPVTDKLGQDIKAAVINGSLTIPQVKELKQNI